MFIGVHALLAMNLQTPELAISDEEGKQFMGAAQNVMRHYSVQTTQKTLDWIALFGSAGAIYAPRVVAIRMRKSRPRHVNQPSSQNMGGNVHDFPVMPSIEPEYHG